MSGKHYVETERKCISCNSDETRLELRGKESWDVEDIIGSMFNLEKNTRQKFNGEELSIFLMCDNCSIHTWLMKSTVDEYSGCESNLMMIEDWYVERDGSNDVVARLEGKCPDSDCHMECVLSFELVTQRKSKEEILNDFEEDNN